MHGYLELSCLLLFPSTKSGPLHCIRANFRFSGELSLTEDLLVILFKGYLVLFLGSHPSCRQIPKFSSLARASSSPPSMARTKGGASGAVPHRRRSGYFGPLSLVPSQDEPLACTVALLPVLFVGWFEEDLAAHLGSDSTLPASSPLLPSSLRIAASEPSISRLEGSSELPTCAASSPSSPICLEGAAQAMVSLPMPSPPPSSPSLADIFGVSSPTAMATPPSRSQPGSPSVSPVSPLAPFPKHQCIPAEKLSKYWSLQHKVTW